MRCRYSRLRKRSSTWHTPNTQVTSMATTNIPFWMPRLSCRRSTTRRVARFRQSSTELKECPITRIEQVIEPWARVASGKRSSHSGKSLRPCSLKTMERQITRLHWKTFIISTTLVRSTSEHLSKPCGWYGTPAAVNFWLSHRTVKIARAASLKSQIHHLSHIQIPWSLARWRTWMGQVSVAKSRLNASVLRLT